MHKILVIQQKMIGDVLTSTILCEALNNKYPNAQITYLINRGTEAVVMENPFIDEILFFETQYRTSKTAFYQFLKEIKAKKYDLVIDAYGKTESNLISFFSKSPKRISFYKWYTRWMYTTTIKRKNIALTNASLAIENRLRLFFEEDKITSNILKPKIYLNAEELQKAKDFLRSYSINLDQPLIMIGVLGSGINKTYPLSYMAAIIDRIVTVTNAQILFNYIPNQKADAQTVYDLCQKKTRAHIYFETFGKSLRDFLAITAHCNALIGNEGGAVNMAKALDKPTFTIFSPWIPKEGWSIFEDGKKHVSVHLKEIKPELYGTKSPKEMKKKALPLYQEFDPSNIVPQLDRYLQQLVRVK